MYDWPYLCFVGVDEVMRAEPHKESGLHVSETLSVRSRLTLADPAA